MKPTKIAEGREAEIFSWAEGEVLRLYRDPSHHDRADRELLALNAVRSALPCVPAPLGRLDWNGRPGVRMERVDGHGIFAEIQRRPWSVWSLANRFGRVHGELNGLRAPDSLPELRKELRRRIDAYADIPDELRASALDELARLPDGDSLCHGDFHPENVLLCSSGPVVIDWPNATRGDSCGDFARTLLMVKLGALPPGTPPLIRWAQGIGRGLFVRAYVAGYETTKRYDADLVRRWQLVRAVHRLVERIPEERIPLLRAAEELRCVLRARTPAA